MKGKMAAAVGEGGAVILALDQVRELGTTAEEVLGGMVAASAAEEVQGGRAASSAVSEVRERGTATSAVDQVGDAKKPLTGRDLALLLRKLNGGGEAPNHVHENNVYSDGPANLVQGRQHAFRATGHVSQMVWLFYTRKPLANGKNRRPRKVGGKEGGTWHEEKDEPDITGVDGEPVLGYMKRFSYRSKNPGRRRGDHTGWSMFQISMQKDGDEKVLCMLCKSNRKQKLSTAICSNSKPRSTTRMEEIGVAPATSTGKSLVDVEEEAQYREKAASELTVVMALGESSILSAQRFKVMTQHILSLTEERPVVLLSAIGGEHTNIEQAVRQALMLTCGGEASELHGVAAIKELYLGTVHELGLDSAIVIGPLNRLEEHLQSILLTKELTPATQDYLASFGERISATIFCAYLKAHGKNAHQVWKDAHGVVTRDPSIFTNDLSFTYFSLHDAVELACSGARGMNPGPTSSVVEDDIPVIIVKNPCNPQARGKQERELSKSKLSCIMLKPNIVMLDIASTGAPNQRDSLAQVSSIFEDSGISVDLDASKGGNIFLTLHPSTVRGSKLSHQGIVNLVEKVNEVAIAQLEHISIISLIGNEHESTSILAKAIDVLASIGVHAKKASQRSSKVVEVTLVVDNSVAKDCVRALHSAFFETGFVSQGVDREVNSFPVQVAESSHAAEARSGDKRKVDDQHPEAPPGVRQKRADTDRDGPDEMELRLFSRNNPTIGGEGDPPDGALDAFFHSIASSDIEPVRVDVSTLLTEQANDIALSDIQRLLFHEQDPVLVGGNNDTYPDREWARLLVQPEQQVLDEAAEGGDRLRTGTEVLLQEFSPDLLLGPCNGEMSCPPPPPFVPS